MVEKPSIVYWLENNLYLNITNKCSNDCWFCFRNFKTGVGGFNLKLDYEPGLAEIISELEKNISRKRWNEIVFCGFGEPTERLDILLEITKWIKRYYPSSSIRLDTNGHGYYLNKTRDVAKDLKEAGINKVSVSLNGFNSETYYDNCRSSSNGAFDAVLEFVSKASQSGLEVEVTAVRLPESDLSKIKEVVDQLNVPLRIREYIPCFW